MPHQSPRWLALAMLMLLVHGADGFAQSGSRSYGSSTRPRSTGGTTATPGSGSSTRQQPRQPQATPAPRRSFDAKLWDFLISGKYRNWGPAPGQTDGLYEGQSPHGAFLKMYLNRRAAGNSQTLPAGSVIVKENYGPDQKTLMAITVMYRSEGFNPDAGDWYWIKYNPDGSVARMPADKGAARIMGKPAGCIDCHQDAAGGDYAFFND